MDVYILDTLYRRVGLVDRYESMIWTERFAAYGDFEFHVLSSLENRTRFLPGVRLAINESYRVMTIETVEDTTDDNGVKLLKLTGRSLEAILDDRVARGTLGNLTDTPKWTLTGLPAAIARKMFHDICVTGILNAADVITGVHESSIFPADTIAEPSDPITIEVDLITLYTALKNLCDMYGMGFRLVKNFDTSQLYFDVYMGSDRTTQQTSLPAVIFSPDLGTLQNVTEISSIAVYKNCAYVFSKLGSLIVYNLDVDPATTGFERRVLLVNVSDLTDNPDDPMTTDEINAYLQQKGLEALAQNRRLAGLDGEINQYSPYVYGRDYNLGDLVEQRNTDGATNQLQVTEQIFISDKEGVRSYPTLTVNTFITPGSWSAWDYNKVWFDYDASSETWSDQP